jgi:ABC-2 type transport system permease protein
MRFAGLVENEILKISRQRRFRVVVLILVALIGLIVFAQARGRDRYLGGKDWRVRTQERMASIQNWLRDGRMPVTSQRWARFELGRMQYHLERDIDPDAISGPLFTRAFANASSYLPLPLFRDRLRVGHLRGVPAGTIDSPHAARGPRVLASKLLA